MAFQGRSHARAYPKNGQRFKNMYEKKQTLVKEVAIIEDSTIVLSHETSLICLK